MSKPLEEIERELSEAEPITVKEKGFNFISVVLGYIIWLILSLGITIYTTPDGLSNIAGTFTDIVAALPAQGYIIINYILAKEYVTAAEIGLPLLISGLVIGILAGSVNDGILAGALTWVLGFIIGFIVGVAYLPSISIETISSLLISYLNDSLFIDPVVLVIFGAIGGAVRR